MVEFNLLNTIKSPADVKKLSGKNLEQLCAEIREGILNRVSKKGGHLGPNLGIVEVTAALHYVFNSPDDKIVWDVSHQCYPHKMLTGRAFGFTDDERFDEISGYTAPQESEHDIFTVGHTSTSVSLATGLAKARDMQGGKNNVIAVIGDGSLSGGEAFEGLDNAAELKSNFIVVVNDNQMSIAENHGGIYGNLAVLRATKGKASNNIFSALGYDYYYVENGNKIEDLIKVFAEVKDTDRPTLVHVHTLKGCGYQPAVSAKEAHHWVMPFDRETDRMTVTLPQETYGTVVADYLLQRAAVDNKLAVINAATPGALALGTFRQKYPEKYFDVGIAEEHAVAFTSAMAKSGMKPVALFFGGFIQRAYDQLSQDLCLNKSPAVLVIENGGISAMDVTHLGIFDIPLMSNIPDLVCLAPTTKEETLRMLDWAMEQKDFPVVIRTPGSLPQELKYAPKMPLALNKSEVVKKGSKIALLGLGNFLKLAEDTAELLADKGIDATIVNPRFYSRLDTELLDNLAALHDVVVTMEDGIIDGGFGEKVAGYLGDKNIRVYNFGAKKEFTDRVPLEELYKRYDLTPEQIVAKIL
ncbi:MAG: 1-deoxy-D-xylulose-5-phosphate synthase [Pseudomonadota bacterium]|nr:1-deoxy-D-xylulose-5-phosphate synthase [Pseudomonadota bacterium]